MLIKCLRPGNGLTGRGPTSSGVYGAEFDRMSGRVCTVSRFGWNDTVRFGERFTVSRSHTG